MLCVLLLAPVSPGASMPSGVVPRHSAASSKKTKGRKRERKQQVPTPDRIREIQSALVRSGYLEGEPSGKWDTGSTDAMRRFQESNGLQPTGKLDARSLQKLGLGSDVAGLGAPQLPQTSANSPR